MKKFLPWALALVVLLVVFGTIYTAVQQAQRSDANYSQIQLAAVFVLRGLKAEDI